MITWLLADRNFPYLLGLLCVAASLIGAGLAALGLLAMEKLRSGRTPQLRIEWEGLE